MDAEHYGTFASFIPALEAELASFTDKAVPLLSHQLQAFQNVLELLNEDDERSQKRSKQRRSEVARAREFVIDVYLRIGADMFLLCVSALPITTLAKLKSHQLLPGLDKWWKAAERPHGLKVVATELCKDNQVGDIIYSYRKKQYPGLNIPLGKSHESISNTMSTAHDIQEDKRHSDQRVMQMDSETSRKRTISQVSRDPKDFDGHKNWNMPHDSGTNTSTTILSLEFSRLINFLQQHQQQGDVQMVCPYYGIPLPYLELKLDTDGGITTKIEISLLTSKALIQYLQASRTAHAEAANGRAA